MLNNQETQAKAMQVEDVDIEPVIKNESLHASTQNNYSNLRAQVDMQRRTGTSNRTSLANHRVSMYQKIHRVQKDQAKLYQSADLHHQPNKTQQQLPYQGSEQSNAWQQSSAQHGAQPSDKNFLLMNSRFSGLFDAIEHKTYSKPELGRILTDKGYAKCKDYKP